MGNRPAGAAPAVFTAGGIPISSPGKLLAKAGIAISAREIDVLVATINVFKAGGNECVRSGNDYRRLTDDDLPDGDDRFLDGINRRRHDDDRLGFINGR